jgi:hypothetical protein
VGSALEVSPVSEANRQIQLRGGRQRGARAGRAHFISRAFTVAGVIDGSFWIISAAAAARATVVPLQRILRLVVDTLPSF